MNGFVGGGYFKKKSAAGVDTYTRTDKPYKGKSSDRKKKGTEETLSLSASNHNGERHK
jgi:hypothetical protein